MSGFSLSFITYLVRVEGTDGRMQRTGCVFLLGPWTPSRNVCIKGHRFQNDIVPHLSISWMHCLISLRLLPVFALYAYATTAPTLSQSDQQRFQDRLWQTNLRGPRWTGNDNQNTLTSLVAQSMQFAGLDVQLLNYTIDRWDPQWWSLTLTLNNGTVLGLPTTGYWPYSGDSGVAGVTAPVHDAGSFAVDPITQKGVTTSLNLKNLPSSGSVVFFDNPSPTHNYSEPGYKLLGYIDESEIPELGNLTNPHWQSAKSLDFTSLKSKGVSAIISSWVNTSDDDASLQFLPNDGAPGDGSVHYDVPALYVGNSTGELVRGLVAGGQVNTATVVLNAPSYQVTTSTVISHLAGTSGTNDTIIVYTHSDGPSIIEENGPILLLAMAEVLARQKPSINIDFVITTGHLSGGHLNESNWMVSRPDLLANAKAAIVCEHFGAIEWKDDFSSGVPVYKATGSLEPMWTMANSSAPSDLLHQMYIDAFNGTSDDLRMAMISPQVVNGKKAMWYGAGGSSILGYSQIPTIGIIPQPDYLWAQMVDGGWSRLDIDEAIEQVNVILRLLTMIDDAHTAGQL
ncbi:hypothetical protein D9757_008816 [Collybiopsis confluens]|uniref:Uncharacterized protein n=1 Tax=Collybiopsis confluens TaxID=2823264 RepID=A0A8H5H3B3_9AGAR|nr:hypothetical protein D9757_008816 [Collybiopsis confluens]